MVLKAQDYEYSGLGRKHTYRKLVKSEAVIHGSADEWKNYNHCIVYGIIVAAKISCLEKQGGGIVDMEILYHLVDQNSGTMDMAALETKDDVDYGTIYVADM